MSRSRHWVKPKDPKAKAALYGVRPTRTRTVSYGWANYSMEGWPYNVTRQVSLLIKEVYASGALSTGHVGMHSCTIGGAPTYVLRELKNKISRILGSKPLSNAQLRE